MWRARFGRGFGPVVRQTAKWMNESVCLLFSLKATQASRIWLLVSVVSRRMKLIAGNLCLSAWALSYVANCPCKSFSSMHSCPFIYSAFIRLPFQLSVYLPPTVYTWLKYVLYRISCLICHQIFFFNDLSNCLHMLDDSINKYHLPRLPTYLRSCPFIFSRCVTYKQAIIILCCLRLPLEELQRYLSRIIGHECSARPETSILTKP